MMHNHDTNETFVPMTGRWRCSWEVDGRVEHVDLGPMDVISFPAGVQRRFENVTFDEPDVSDESLPSAAGLARAPHCRHRRAPSAL